MSQICYGDETQHNAENDKMIKHLMIGPLHITAIAIIIVTCSAPFRLTLDDLLALPLFARSVHDPK